MNRRDFLVTAATAGAALPVIARAATPCPPPTLSVQGGQSVSTPCVLSQVGPPPAWWTALAAGQWAAIASSGTIGGAAPSPAVADSETGQSAVISSWSGATVDQSNRRFILLANGGHADYAGNEGYRLDLGNATPAWQRFIEPTPNANLTYNDNPAGPFAVNSDGRARSMHTSGFQSFGDGYIWYPYCNSYNSPSGGSAPGMASFNMNNGALLSAIAANTPLAWDGTAGPWSVLGTISDGGSGISHDGATGAASFGVSVFDRVGHRVFGLGGLGYDRTNCYVWYINTEGSSFGQSVSYVLNSGNPYADFRWAVCAYDLNIIVAADGAHNRLVVFNLANVGGSGWYTAVTPPGNGYYGGGVSGPFPGAGYVATNHTIGVGDPPNIGNTIYKLQIPTTVSGGKTVYNPSGTWAWTSTTAGGATLTFPDDTKPYTRFNIIEDMGDGTAALIYVGGLAAPTYVYKVPVTGL
jgi:hypothetical protein